MAIIVALPQVAWLVVRIKMIQKKGGSPGSPISHDLHIACLVSAYISIRTNNETQYQQSTRE